MQNFRGQIRCIMGNVEVAYITFFEKASLPSSMTMHDSHNVCFRLFMRFFPKRGQFDPYYTT